MTLPATQSMNTTSRPPLDLDDLVSVEEGAATSGLSPATVRRMAADGRIRAKKIGDAWVVDRSSLPFITDAAAIVLDIEQAVFDLTGLAQTRDGLAEAVGRLATKARLYDEAVAAYLRAVGAGPLSTTLGYALGGLHGVRQVQPGGVAVQLTSSNWVHDRLNEGGRVQGFACSECGTTWAATQGAPTYCPNECQTRGRAVLETDALPLCETTGLPHRFAPWESDDGRTGAPEVCADCGQTPAQIRSSSSPVSGYGVFEDATITSTSKVTFTEDAVNDLRERLR
jgi:hypothetical protein